MIVNVNGAPHNVPDACTLAQLLELLDAPSRGIAVAKNDRVVRRASFGEELLSEGDRIEIIQAVAGG